MFKVIMILKMESNVGSIIDYENYNVYVLKDF